MGPLEQIDDAEGLATHADLPGEQFRPSNATVGDSFIADWCANCARDRLMNGAADPDNFSDEDLCQILAASYRKEGAREWRITPKKGAFCAAFTPIGEDVRQPCQHTGSLF